LRNERRRSISRRSSAKCWRYCSSSGCANLRGASRLLAVWIEAADAEPASTLLSSVDNPSGLSTRLSRRVGSLHLHPDCPGLRPSCSVKFAATQTGKARLSSSVSRRSVWRRPGHAILLNSMRGERGFDFAAALSQRASQKNHPGPASRATAMRRSCVPAFRVLPPAFLFPFFFSVSLIEKLSNALSSTWELPMGWR